MLAPPGEGGRRMGTDGRELDQVLEPGLLGSLDESALSLHQALINGREEQSSFHAGQRNIQRVGRVEVGADELGARLVEVVRLRRILDHRSDLPACLEEGLDDKAAVRAGRPSDEDHHRPPTWQLKAPRFSRYRIMPPSMTNSAPTT